MASEPIRELTPEALEQYHSTTAGTLPDLMGIELIEARHDRMVGRMPVERRVHQPFGLLHGGASVALAETLASMGAWLNIDQATQSAVGLEINANHVRSIREGIVTGVAVPLHIGRTTQLWEIRITDEQERLICISRCTIAVVQQH